MTGILFDFGGTIDTDGVHWSEKFWDWYRAHGIDERFGIEKKLYEKAFVESDAYLLRRPDIASLSFRDTLELQLAEQFRILNIADSALRADVTASGYADVAATIARASALLLQCRQRYKIALVSNFYGNLDAVCREFRLDTIFDILVDSAVVGVKKPDPGIFMLALERLAVSPADAYVVGDSYERDIVPGKSAGCSTVWLRGRSWTDHPSAVPSADHVIGSLEELRPIVM